jgi:hypothetical protein
MARGIALRERPARAGVAAGQQVAALDEQAVLPLALHQIDGEQPGLGDHLPLLPEEVGVDRQRAGLRGLAPG